jgi:hypothetical protein
VIYFYSLPVAQPGRATGLGPVGREFESLQADHINICTTLVRVRRNGGAMPPTTTSPLSVQALRLAAVAQG